MHEVYALHVGDKQTTRAQFLYRDPSNEALTISFYLWVVLGGPEPVVYDVSFDADHAKARGLHTYNDRTELLGHLDLRPEDIRTVVMSHLHWDHWAGSDLFPNARFLVQESEGAFWTGRAVRHELIMASADRAALEAYSRLNLSGRIALIEGEKELWPGLRLVPLGGHTPGIQVMVVETGAGTVVLANDVMHYYENYERRRPVQVTMDMLGALEAFDKVQALAEREELIVAGHDPALQTRFRKVAPGVFRIA